MATARSGSYSAGTGENIYGGTVPVIAHVFLESGQSNCQGRGALADAPISAGVPIGSVKTWRRSLNGDMYSGTGQWLDLEYATNQYEGRGEFGSVLKLGINLRDKLEDANNHIYIIKADGNGKPIVGWLSGGLENTAMYAGHITPALANLQANPIYDEIRIHSFTWDQGEGDSDTLAEANAYSARLATLVSDLRTTLSIPELPIIIRRTESTHVSHTYVGIVSKAQEDFALSDPYTELIVGPWGYIGDAVHLNGAAQNSVGDQRYAITRSMTNGVIYG